MTLKVIGAGVGRTGTYSLKLALEQLGVGPCYHMESVMQSREERVALWNRVLDGAPDWGAIYEGFGSAVDWPTAAYFRELSRAYPWAKFILTHRSKESWAASFSETIYKLLAGKDEAPPEMRAWLVMAERVIAHTGMPPGLDARGLQAAFVAHNETVKAAIPAERLLVYEVKEGWAPLCAFLGVDAPEGDFPRTNDRAEFWDLVSGKT